MEASKNGHAPDMTPDAHIKGKEPTNDANNRLINEV